MKEIKDRDIWVLAGQVFYVYKKNFHGGKDKFEMFIMEKDQSKPITKIWTYKEFAEKKRFVFRTAKHVGEWNYYGGWELWNGKTLQTVEWGDGPSTFPEWRGCFRTLKELDDFYHGLKKYIINEHKNDVKDEFFEC